MPQRYFLVSKHSFLVLTFAGIFFFLSSPPINADSVTVTGTDVVFLAGRDDVTIPPLGEIHPSFPLGRHDIVLPEFLLERFPQMLPAKEGLTFSFTASGSVHYFVGTGGGYPPDGGHPNGSNLFSLAGISGYKGPSGALVGVFLSDSNPSGMPPPATLNFQESGLGTSFLTLLPEPGQVFFVGDGITADGLSQHFVAPAGAIRLYLGIPDGWSFDNQPGWYNDNDGFFSVDVDTSLILDQQNPIFNPVCCGTSNNFGFRRVQSFTIGVGGVLARIEVALQLDLRGNLQGLPDSFVLSDLNLLRMVGDANSGLPGPAIIARALATDFSLISATYNPATDVTAISGWVGYELANFGVDVNSGDALALELVPGENGSQLGFPRGADYPGGTLFYQTEGTTTFIPEIPDIPFRSFVMAAQVVEIDVKPDSSENVFNVKSQGKIPVAVITTDDFDATQVDWESVQFGPNGATEAHERAHISDVDLDRDMDVVFHFDTQDTGIQCDAVEAMLIGETFSGEDIIGTNSIVTVNCD